MEANWLTIIIILLIVVVTFDGVRRVRRARRDSIKMSLRPVSRNENLPDKGYGSEFPNGGARPSSRKIDPQRIKKVRSKYDFGDDLPSWSEKLGEKVIATIDKFSDDSAAQKAEDRIEPSLDESVYFADKEQYSDSEEQFDDDSGHLPPLADDIESGNTLRQPETDRADTTKAKITNPDIADPEVSPNADPDEDSPTRADVDSDGEKYANEESIKDPSGPDDRALTQTEPATAIESSAKTSASGKTASIDANPRVSVQTSLNLKDSVPMLMDTLDKTDAVRAPLEDGSEPLESDPATDLETKDLESTSQNSSAEIKHTEMPKPHTRLIDKLNKAKQLGKIKQSSKVKRPSHNDPSTTQIQPSDVLIIHIKAAAEEQFHGSDLLKLLLENGLRYGDMNIFHYHAGEDGEGPVLFSMANMVKPGNFDLHSFETFSTVGLSFFLALPSASGEHMRAFELMLSTIQKMASALPGELKDEQRSVLTKQTIEHYRERVRDFSRRQQLQKSKSK